jgi:hypothetical protein
MSATTGAALKVLIEGGGLTLQAFRDRAPNGTKLVDPLTGKPTPYCTTAEGLSLTGDGYEDGEESTTTELAQVDLWEPWRDAKEKPLETKGLPAALHRVLKHGRLPTSPTQVYGILIRNVIKRVDMSNNLVQHSYTLGLRRVI